MNELILFFFYSLLGWAYESFICSPVELGYVKNRGFLIGPFCPIYGLGAIFCQSLLGGIDSLFILFVRSAIICCLFEYAVGSLLEYFFGRNWWDYTNYPFQIGGKVCLYGFLIFGIANVFMIKVITPILMFWTSLISLKLIYGCLFALSLGIISDTAITVTALTKNSGKVYELYMSLQNAQRLKVFGQEVGYARAIGEKAKTFNDKMKSGQNLIKRVF